MTSGREGTIALPLALRWLRRLEFPHKLGICERLFGDRLSKSGTCWVETAAGIIWKLDLANPTHRWIIFGKYEGSAFLDWARRFLPTNGTVVDSGANIGQMLIYLSQYVPKGKVLAFEPGKEAADWLEECLAIHPELPVELLRLGLGEREARLFLRQVGSKELHGGRNQISEEVGEGEAVKVVRLEDVLESQGIDTVDLWKLDVEGYEIFALRGAERFMREERIEALYVELAFGNGKEIVDYLAQFGYRCYLFDRRGRLYAPKHLPAHTNGLFLPTSKAGSGARESALCLK
jgi:FkbM family methyltransferase